MDFSSIFFPSERNRQHLFELGVKNPELVDDLADSCVDEFWTLGADPFGDLLAIPDEDLGLTDSDLEPPAYRWETLILQRDPTVELHSVAAWDAHEQRHALYYQGDANDDSTQQTAENDRKTAQKFAKFPCTFCARKFGTATTLKYHALTHASAQQLAHAHQCPHCAHTYRSKSELTRHFKRCHRDHLFTCHLCAQIFVAFPEYDAHVAAKACQLFACRACDACFMRVGAFKRHLLTHLRTHTNDASDRAVVHSNQKLARRCASKKDVFDNNRDFSSYFAGKSDNFDQNQNSRTHMADRNNIFAHNHGYRTRISSKKDVCERKPNLRKHFPGNEAMFDRNQGFSKHISSKKDGSVGNEAMFDRNQGFSKHISSKKDGSVGNEAMFDRNQGFSKHISSKKDVSVGNEAMFDRNQGFSKHISSKKDVSVGNEAMFDRNQGFSKHISSKNYVSDGLQDPMHRCAQCDARFDAQSKLSRHARLKHAPPRFACAQCGKRFVRADHHQIHMRRHYAQKPCACDLCDKRFCQKSDLNRHRKYVHLGARRKCAVGGTGSAL